MRLQIYITILILLGSFNVLAADTGAPSPFPIWGIISIDGVRANVMSISLAYPTTGESISIDVNGGEFITDLSEFSTRVNPDNPMTITYCIGDSRCREVTDTFTPTQVFVGRNGISKDLPLQPTGLAGPFNVYGHVLEYGVIQEGADVLIENLNTGDSKTIETNEAGEYLWNIANWGRYDTGDLIRVTWGDHVVTGYVSGAGLELDIKIVQASPPPDTPPQSEDNGGGHQGGGCDLNNRIYWLKGDTCQSSCPGYEKLMTDQGYVKVDYNCFTNKPGETTPGETPDTPPEVIPEDPKDSIIPDMPEVTPEQVEGVGKTIAIIAGILIALCAIVLAVRKYMED